MKFLVTGGCGFIGSNFIRYFLRSMPDAEIINMDALTYAGNLQNLAGVSRDSRYTFVKTDITDAAAVNEVFEEHKPEVVLNFAAESHVDRSIEDPQLFLRTNILGTQVLLNAANRYGCTRFVQISTDEVYGQLGPVGSFTEATPLAPRSPYSSSKAGADLLAMAYYSTYNLPVLITRCSNNYGPYQFPEKLIPLAIINAYNWNAIPVYGDGLYVRDWLHVDDHCAAIEYVLSYGQPGQVYNIGGGTEINNLELIKRILKIMDRPTSLIKHVEDRPGHDRRYSIDWSKIRRELDWKPEVNFEQGLEQTVQWYLGNTEWWNAIISGAYRDYYDRMYAERADFQ
ncbi:MAG: dTDP-glucose 4,6-dehydratase [Candidatus Sumerlaeaceae bacterium]